MSSAAALTWFARHEFRLAWREWLAMMTAGRRNRKRALIGLVVFAVILHLPAYAVIGRFTELRLPLDKSSLIVLSASIFLAWALMLSQAIESVTRVFYARADLDLIMSSPVRLGPIRRNSTSVIAIAAAEADSPMAITTPNAASQRAPPPITSTSTNGVDNNSAMKVTVSTMEAMRMEKTLASRVGDDMIRSRSARA